WSNVSSVTHRTEPRRRSYYMSTAMSASTILAAGQSRWPHLPLSVAAIAARLETDEADTERAADLFLAFALAERVPGAVEVFQNESLGDLAAVHARFANTGVTLDELRQQLVTRICVGDEQRPAAIAGYRGRGSLRSWLRVSAVRALTDAA